MKLCRVIAYYITSITKQFKFLKSHCPIVCSYCSVVCLEFFSSSLKLNEINKVDSLFNEDLIFPGRTNFGEGRPENVRKMGNNRDICCYTNRGLVNFEREYQPLPSRTKILVMRQFSSCQTKF